MKIALNITPLKTSHKTRGVGYYTKNLLASLKKRTDIEVQEFTRLDEVKDTSVVHYPWFDLFFKTLPLRKRFHTIVTIHDVIPLIFPKQYPLGLKGKVNLFIQKLSLKNASLIITDSENSKKDINQHLKIPLSKIKVVPLAASNEFRILKDAEKLRFKRKYNLVDDFLLYVGDGNYIKNLPFLIEGFKQLISNQEYNNLKLVLVGGVFLKKLDNINHPELDSLKKLNDLIDKYELNKNIIKPGQIETKDLVGFYNLATIYIQPSLYEGFGLPVLEAMVCGAPVISSRVASLSEVGGNAAIYFDPHDLGQFIKVTTELLENPSIRKKLSKLGVNHAAKYSWERVADETVRVYQEAFK